MFITNRFPTRSIRARIGRNFTFDLDDIASSNSVFFCSREGNNRYNEIDSRAFLNRLKQTECGQILIYIHAFSNLAEDAFKDAQEFQNLCNRKKKNDVLVIPMIWPCDNDLGIVRDYWHDQKAADQSAYSFARVLQKFMAWRNSNEFNPQSDPCLKRINVLAHSMGNRVLRGTLWAWNNYDLASSVPLLFRNTFLVAADVVNETLHVGHSGELICHASRNVVVYHASDDLALRARKAANLKNRIASRQLGHSGPEDIDQTPKNVYSVDCDDVNNAYDRPKRHSYFRSGRRRGTPGKVFNHIYESLRTGRVYPDDEFRRSPTIR